MVNPVGAPCQPPGRDSQGRGPFVFRAGVVGHGGLLALGVGAGTRMRLAWLTISSRTSRRNSVKSGSGGERGSPMAAFGQIGEGPQVDQRVQLAHLDAVDAEGLAEMADLWPTTGSVP